MRTIASPYSEDDPLKLRMNCGVTVEDPDPVRESTLE
jgi:hypothetical protein